MSATPAIGKVWQPSKGVNQVEVSLNGGKPPISMEEALDRFMAIDGVKGAGAVGTMWVRGHVDLSLTSDTLTPQLEAAILAVCNEINAS